MTVWTMWLLCVPAFAALSLAMDKHHAQALNREMPEGQLWPWRIAGVVLLVLALVVSLHHWGASVAVVAWLGSLTFAALLVGALLTYAPRKLPGVALFSVFMGVVSAGVNW